VRQLKKSIVAELLDRLRRQQPVTPPVPTIPSKISLAPAEATSEGGMALPSQRHDEIDRTKQDGLFGAGLETAPARELLNDQVGAHVGRRRRAHPGTRHHHNHTESLLRALLREAHSRNRSLRDLDRQFKVAFLRLDHALRQR